MYCLRISVRNIRCFLVILVALSLFNALFVLFKYEWSPDEDHIFSEKQDYGQIFMGKDRIGLACIHPQLQLWPESFEQFFTEPQPLQCDEYDWVTIQNSTYCINDAVIKRYGSPLCEVTPLIRGADDFTVLEGPKIKPVRNGINIPTDFSEVRCVSQTGDVYKSLHSGIAANQSLIDHSKILYKDANERPMNILMVGFDSVSHMTWQRNLPMAHAYFTSELGGVVMAGYNIVGDGTPQALLPILTGRNESELAEARRGVPGATTVDEHPWLWRHLHRLGYVTLWGEDGASTGTFTLRMLGFKHQPVHHYMRPFYLRGEAFHFAHQTPYCLGARPRHRNMLNWARQLYENYQTVPKFSFIFHSELSHSSHLNLKLADSDVRDFLVWLNEKGHLNNTALIMMSDHGARFQAVRSTMQGKYEERLPYFGILLPQWYRTKYREKYQNLINNRNKLTTPFDVHKTLLELSGVQIQQSNEHRNTTRRANSMLSKIPENRTCQDAGIEPHWCACLQWNDARVSDKRVRSTAQEVVRVINKLTHAQRKQCTLLTLKRIVSASIYHPNTNIVQFKHSVDKDGRIPVFDRTKTVNELFYQVTIETEPNMGLYEATVVHLMKPNRLLVTEKQISRINVYGSQPHCIQDKLPHLRQYCFCTSN